MTAWSCPGLCGGWKSFHRIFVDHPNHKIVVHSINPRLIFYFVTKALKGAMERCWAGHCGFSGKGHGNVVSSVNWYSKMNKSVDKHSIRNKLQGSIVSVVDDGDNMDCRQIWNSRPGGTPNWLGLIKSGAAWQSLWQWLENTNNGDISRK